MLVTKITQKDRVLAILEEHKGEFVSNLEIYNRTRIWRIAAIIFTLKKEGYDIEAKQDKNPLHWYKLNPTQLTLLKQ